MSEAILRACGGLGIFLLGMFVMTEGLRSLAGARLQQVLERFTRSPASGAVTGAATTALIQSSSATTIAAVGFVSAGLITFPQSLGVLFGANIGTTVTGWIVAILGFKLPLGIMVLPLVLVGTLLRMLGREPVALVGQAIAGFGLIFVGIGMLQEGMLAVEGVVTPESFPDGSIPGMLLLVLIGFGITLVTQSSSAGVATAITAVSAGAINLNQAGALVIGMDVGTTVTAFVASVGGSVSARRTGVAHVLYNMMTAVLALLILDSFMSVWRWGSPAMMTDDPEIVLVAFHTFFNALGVLLVLPLTGRFAALVCWMIPERAAVLTGRLDRNLLADPSVASVAVGSTLRDIARQTIGIFSESLRREPVSRAARTHAVREIESAIDVTRSYVGEITLPRLTEAQRRRLEAALHTLDHVDRLIARCAADQKAAVIRLRPDLRATVHDLRAALDEAIRWLDEPTPDAPDEGLEPVWEALQRNSEGYREAIMSSASLGEIKAGEALAALDAHRWLRRSVYHVWRILHHLERAMQANPEAAPTASERATDTEAPE